MKKEKIVYSQGAKLKEAKFNHYWSQEDRLIEEQ